jgi:hypothetical protein
MAFLSELILNSSVNSSYDYPLYCEVPSLLKKIRPSIAVMFITIVKAVASAKKYILKPIILYELIMGLISRIKKSFFVESVNDTSAGHILRHS